MEQWCRQGTPGSLAQHSPTWLRRVPAIVATTHQLHRAQSYAHSAASSTLCSKEGHACCIPAVLLPCHAVAVPCVLWRHQVGEEPEDEEEQQLRALQLEDLEDHGTVGAGTSGVVNKVVHLPTARTLALKVRRNAPASGWCACLFLQSDEAPLRHAACRVGNEHGGACQQSQDHTAPCTKQIGVPLTGPGHKGA